MGNFANTLFSSLLGWLRGAAAWLWDFLSNPENGGFIVWVADNWLVLTVLLCAACMVIDLIVYMIRWQPYKVWASFFRRLMGRGEDKQDSGRIRRRWIHADGTTSIEEVDPEEVIPEEAPAPVYVPEEPGQYYARFARPQAEAPVYVEPQPEPEPVAEEAPQEIPERPARPASGRRRRYMPAGEELPLNYTAPAVSEDAPAYHEPYVPPQWKRPADSGSSNIDLGGSGL